MTLKLQCHIRFANAFILTQFMVIGKGIIYTHLLGLVADTKTAWPCWTWGYFLCRNKAKHLLKHQHTSGFLCEVFPVLPPTVQRHVKVNV